MVFYLDIALLYRLWNYCYIAQINKKCAIIQLINSSKGETAMSTLEGIIDSLENLEVKRALAVKMFLLDFKTEDICKLLNVSDSFVSKWKTFMKTKAPAL